MIKSLLVIKIYPRCSFISYFQHSAQPIVCLASVIVQMDRSIPSCCQVWPSILSNPLQYHIYFCLCKPTTHCIGCPLSNHCFFRYQCWILCLLQGFTGFWCFFFSAHNYSHPSGRLIRDEGLLRDRWGVLNHQECTGKFVWYIQTISSICMLILVPLIMLILILVLLTVSILTLAPLITSYSSWFI